MNIYALKGHKVRCVHTGETRPYGIDDPTCLTVGKEYKVHETWVRSDHTHVMLEEIKGKQFNSVHFEDVEPQSEIEDAHHPDWIYWND